MINTTKLKNDIEKKLANWNERSCFTVKGVKNLSKSDLDTILLYVEQYEKYGSFKGLMQPIGGVKAVLDAYGICGNPIRGMFR